MESHMTIEYAIGTAVVIRLKEYNHEIGDSVTYLEGKITSISTSSSTLSAATTQTFYNLDEAVHEEEQFELHNIHVSKIVTTKSS